MFQTQLAFTPVKQACLNEAGNRIGYNRMHWRGQPCTDARMRRLRWRTSVGENWQNSDFSGAYFHLTQFNRANLSGSAWAQANFIGGRCLACNLTVARMRGLVGHTADFSGSEFEQADLRAAKLWRANFEGASLRAVDLRDAYLVEVNFRNADLRGAKLTNAVIAGAQFAGARVDQNTEMPFPKEQYAARGLVSP